MQLPRMTVGRHVALLALYVVCTVGLLTFPILLLGYPYDLSFAIHDGRVLVETGVILNPKLRLLTDLIAVLHPLIAWDDMISWTVMNIACFALALAPWWWAVRRLFDVRIAWISTVILSLLPLFWEEAFVVSGYPQAYFFLFLSFALFAEFRERRPVLALVTSGLSIGLAIASRDAFLTMIPWLAAAGLWQWRRAFARAAAYVVLFLACAYVAFTLVLLPNALRPGMTFPQRVHVLLLPPEQGTGEGHLYPDQYTYEFLKDEFDARKRDSVTRASFIDRQEDYNFRVLFGVTQASFFPLLWNGVWLLLNALPSLAFQETTGGAFLWLFIIPGAIILWRQRRTLTVHILGLWLLIEFQVRFILHFGRSHLGDIGWALALFAAVGIAGVAASMGGKKREWNAWGVMVFIVLVVALQLLQADRKLLALRYSRSTVLSTYAAAKALKEIPSDAVVAHPRRVELFYFSPQTPVTLHPETIDYLVERGRLQEPFSHYGVQYILGYDAAHTATITKALPAIHVVPLPEHPPAIPVSPFAEYLLNLTR